MHRRETFWEGEHSGKGDTPGRGTCLERGTSREGKHPGKGDTAGKG